MDDITFCQIEIAAAHRDNLEGFFNSEGFCIHDEKPTEGRFIFEDSEASYGGLLVCLEALNATGLPYIGWHNLGGFHGAEVFAGDGTRRAECRGADGRPLVALNDDGDPDPDSLATARTYLAIKRNAERLMKEAV